MAEDLRTEIIKFPRGATGTTITDRIRECQSVGGCRWQATDDAVLYGG